jgi:hypothetical protein
MYAPDGIAFVIDEFEDVAIGHRMTRNKSYEYLATLRSLLDVSQDEQLWLVIAMTQDALKQSQERNPALMQRFAPTMKIQLEPWPLADCKRLAKYWLQRERVDNFSSDPILPFEEDALNVLEERPSLRVPRPFIKLLYLSIQDALNKQVEPPIPGKLVAEMAQRIEDIQSMGPTDGNNE